mgnify:CR=1 FL=1
MAEAFQATAAVKDFFAVVIPGRPIVTAFQPVDETKMVCTIPAPGQITTLAVSFAIALPPGAGIGVYYSDPAGQEWNYLGSLLASSPTAFFRAAWNGLLPPETPYIHLMLALESETDLAERVTADQVEETKTLDSVRGIAQDLYTYMTSFAQPNDPQTMAAAAAQAANGEVLVIPASFIDRWMAKFADKHRKNPFFWMNKTD